MESHFEGTGSHRINQRIESTVPVVWLLFLIKANF